MANEREPQIRARDMQGLSGLRKISPLLSRLRKVGTERDRAGNRRPFMDPYGALILMALFSPAIRSRPDRRFDSAGQRITAVDDTVIETVTRVAELSWTPKGKHLSACRLHTRFEVLSGKAVRIDVTSASPTGGADERAVSQRTVEGDRCSILDRGSISYRLWNAITTREAAPSAGRQTGPWRRSRTSMR